MNCELNVVLTYIYCIVEDKHAWPWNCKYCILNYKIGQVLAVSDSLAVVCSLMHIQAGLCEYLSCIASVVDILLGANK